MMVRARWQWPHAIAAALAATMAWLAPPASGAPCAGFTDVDDASPFCSNVTWLSNRAITLGCSATTYCPTGPVSRLAMAAFLNRFGTALTPVHLRVDQASGPIDLDASPVVCQTSDYTAGDFARAAYANVVLGANATGDVGLAADLVMSSNAGASWSYLNAFPSRGFVRANQWGTVTDLGFAHLLADQSVRFGVRTSRVSGSADLVAARCELRVLLLSADESAPAVVRVLAMSMNASETGPVHGQFTVVRSGGNLAAALIIRFSLGGTASECSDYACIPAIVIPASQSSVAVPVSVLQDTQAEGVETVSLTLLPDPGYVIATPSALVTIADGPPPVNAPPTVSAGANQTITLPAGVNLAGTASDDGNPNPPHALTLTWSMLSGPGTVTFNPVNAAASSATFSDAGTYVLRLTANDSALSASSDVTITVQPAPALDKTIVTDIAATTTFLYEGSNPIQTGVAPGTIKPQRVAIIKGNVRSRSGAPLAGARISILKRPEFGQTFSRADGNYDLAVNGGGKLIVKVEKAGYFEVQRDVIVPWRDFVHAPDVVLTPPDPVASVVQQGHGVVQVARGSAMTDASGTRRATLIMLPGTTAQFRMPNGSLTPAPSQLTVRQTEYTVGPLGPEAMPSELPPTSGYTYYLELTADEELAAGAIGVEFNQPVVFYLENFIGFPVGGAVPVGFYDRQAGVWKSELDGRVLRVIAINGGLAELDTDGNGTIDNGIGTGFGGSNLGISQAERQTLATLYAAGQSLWRVPTMHFSPGDLNWPFGPPPDAIPPNGGDPTNDDRRKSPCDCPPCQGQGSIIECGNQTLGESIPVVGTGMTLNYRSDRVPGRLAANLIGIPITGGTVPASLTGSSVEVNVAGQRFTQTFSNAVAQSTSYAWDGKDTYGRAVQGQQKARVRVGFQYRAVYTPTWDAYVRSWALAGGNPTGLDARNNAYIYRDHDVFVGAWDARGQALGGWSLSEHHVYDHLSRQLYLGSGERRRDLDGLAPVVTTIAGNGTPGAPIEGVPATTSPIVPQGSQLAVEPDGSVLFVSSIAGVRLMRLKPDGTLQRVAGPGPSIPNPPLFGFQATDVSLGYIKSFALGPDGSIYVSHGQRGIITRIRTNDQFMELFAGTFDQLGFAGDGGLATAAMFSHPMDLAVGSDGSVYVHDSGNFRIRKIGPDGYLATIAGNGAVCSGAILPDPLCDNGPAFTQKIGYQAGIRNHLTIGPDGTLYAVRSAGFLSKLELYKIGNDGQLTVIGGDRDFNPTAPGNVTEGIPALEASFRETVNAALAVDRDGLVYYAYNAVTAGLFSQVRFIDREGKVRILAGGGPFGFEGDGGPARAARFSGNIPGLAFNPKGELVIVDAVNYRLRRLQARFPGFTGTADILLAAADGGSVYRFDPNGRHLQTLHGLTGAALLTFAYDGAGRLSTVTDGHNNVTTIQRNASGAPTAIVGPFGQTTQLAVDANGWLTSVTNPANETVTLAHQANGLLTGMTTPNGQTYSFSYEPATGYLLNDADPAGGSKSLARTTLVQNATRLFGHNVAKSTALGRTSAYRSEWLRNGDRVETATATDGTQTVMMYQPGGGMATTYATGTLQNGLQAADPRFGMLAPIQASGAVAMPSGKTLSRTEAVTVTLTDPANVFAINQLTATTTLNGRASTSQYVGTSRQFTDTTPAGRIGTATIDALGRPTNEQFGGLAASTVSYDARGRPVTLTRGSGSETRTTTLIYNAQSYLQSITDPVGRVTSFTYDGAGRPLTQTLPDGRVLAATYDANGNVASVTPPSKPAHAFAYSAVDLETQYNPPDVAGVTPDVTNTSYNADRQPTLLSRPDGRTIAPAYDSAGRVSSVAFSRGATGMTYSPTTGQLVGLTAPDGVSHAFAYDGTLLTSHALAGPVSGVLAWTYDNDFRVASQSVNGGNTVAFAYDADSLLTQAGALAIARSAQSGLVTGTTLGNVADAWTYNSHAEPTDYQVFVSGSPVYRAQFTRDALGRITQKVETINGVADTYAYTYDLAGHLTGANKNAAPIGYTYDGNSNRTSYNGPLGNIASASYDAQDRLTQYGTATYAYNNHGDLVSRTQGASTTQYTYDEFANLTRVVLPGTQIDYVIDARNRRIGKKVNGTLVKRWLYDGQLRIVAELDGAGTLTSRFVYAGSVNVPEYVVQGATTLRLITDYLGSPRLLINTANGAIAGTMNHDEYGRVLQDTLSSLIPFGYAGGHYDGQTGLVRFGARDYDSEIGRWTTKDRSLSAGLRDNFYAYARSAPTQYVDPRGLSGWDVLKNLAKDIGEETAESVVLGDDAPPPDAGKAIGKFAEDGIEALVTKHPVGKIVVGAPKTAIALQQMDALYRAERLNLWNISENRVPGKCFDLPTRRLALRLYRSLQAVERKDHTGLLQWTQQNEALLNVLKVRSRGYQYNAW